MIRRLSLAVLLIACPVAALGQTPSPDEMNVTQVIFKFRDRASMTLVEVQHRRVK